MNKEEQEYIEHEIVDRLYCLEEKDFDKTKVTEDYIQAILKAGKENKKLIDKLQKDNEELKENSISKDTIRDKIKELEEVKQKEEKENKDEFGINSNTWAIADWGIEVLKELLGE